MFEKKQSLFLMLYQIIVKFGRCYFSGNIIMCCKDV
jgi:hypothetical protein